MRSSRRKPAAGRSSPPRSRIWPASTRRSPTSSPASTPSATRRGTSGATARGAASSCRWPAPSITPRTKKGLLRPDRPLNLIPLLLYAAAGVVYAVHFARREPGVGRAATTLLLLAALVTHLRHRHADDGSPPRAVRQPLARGLVVRVAAGAVVPLSRAHDRRACDGRLHPADRGRAADDPGASTRASRAPTRYSTAPGSGSTSPRCCLPTRASRSPACWG